ncbi:20735_t:CDS:2, partial [Dentiscutata erythropus]
NSIPSSNLTQAIYNSLISILELDKNLEGDVGFSFEYCVDFTDLLNFQESSNLSKSSIANKLIEKHENMNLTSDNETNSSDDENTVETAEWLSKILNE